MRLIHGIGLNFGNVLTQYTHQQLLRAQCKCGELVMIVYKQIIYRKKIDCEQSPHS